MLKNEILRNGHMNRKLSKLAHQNICQVKNGKIWIQFPKTFRIFRAKYIGLGKTFFSKQKYIGLEFSHYDFENGISEATRGRKRLF